MTCPDDAVLKSSCLPSKLDTTKVVTQCWGSVFEELAFPADRKTYLAPGSAENALYTPEELEWQTSNKMYLFDWSMLDPRTSELLMERHPRATSMPLQAPAQRGGGTNFDLNSLEVLKMTNLGRRVASRILRGSKNLIDLTWSESDWTSPASLSAELRKDATEVRHQRALASALRARVCALASACVLSHFFVLCQPVRSHTPSVHGFAAMQQFIKFEANNPNSVDGHYVFRNNEKMKRATMELHNLKSIDGLFYASNTGGGADSFMKPQLEELTLRTPKLEQLKFMWLASGEWGCSRSSAALKTET